LAATCINFTAASPALASLVSDWAVQTEKHLSDHYLITANLKVKPDLMPIRFGRHLKKADWPKFQKVVTNAFHKYEDPILCSAAQIEKTTTFFHKSVDLDLDKVAKLTPYRPRKAIFSW
jgi:hypothetical protein